MDMTTLINVERMGIPQVMHKHNNIFYKIKIF